MLHRSTIPNEDGDPSRFVVRVHDDGFVGIYVEGDDDPVVEFSIDRSDGPEILQVEIYSLAADRRATTKRTVYVDPEVGAYYSISSKASSR